MKDLTLYDTYGDTVTVAAEPDHEDNGRIYLILTDTLIDADGEAQASLTVSSARELVDFLNEAIEEVAR